MFAAAPHIDEAQAYLDKIIVSLRALDRREKQPLVALLEYLAEYIRETRGEVAALRSASSDPVALAQASDELEEIVTETAKATNSIMSVAEDMEQLSRGAGEAMAPALLSAATRIYEACAFQDITGQRITKVVRAVQHIDRKIHQLAAICNAAAPAANGPSSKQGDELLLNGPQLATSVQTQDDIDRLFGG